MKQEMLCIGINDRAMLKTSHITHKLTFLQTKLDADETFESFIISLWTLGLEKVRPRFSFRHAGKSSFFSASFLV